MTDEDRELDQWIEEARTAYRSPPEPPLGEMWTTIESRAFGRRVGPRWLRWAAGMGSIAAALVLGFAIGRGTANRVPQVATNPALGGRPASETMSQPYERTATTLLGETVVLLTALPSGEHDALPDRRFSVQASELLVTTRLLLDSQASTDPRLRDLLEDLELILAQIARVHHGQSRTELELIAEALQQRDLVPRIRALAAELAASAD